MPANEAQPYDKGVSVDQATTLAVMQFVQRSWDAFLEEDIFGSVIYAIEAWTFIPEEVKPFVKEPLKELEAGTGIDFLSFLMRHEALQAGQYDNNTTFHGLKSSSEINRKWMNILRVFGMESVKALDAAGLYVSKGRRVIPTANRSPTEPLPILPKLGASIPRKVIE